jgi:hypothetical protein
MSSLVRPLRYSTEVVQTSNSSYPVLIETGSVSGPIALSTVFSSFSDWTARGKKKGELL